MERLDLDLKEVMVSRGFGRPDFNHEKNMESGPRTSKGVRNSATRTLASNKPVLSSPTRIIVDASPVMPAVLGAEFGGTSAFNPQGIPAESLASEMVFSASHPSAAIANSSIYDNAVSPLSAAAKRFFDIIFSIIGLIIFAPVMLIIHFAIYFDDGKPTFFRQERVGFKGRTFTLYKFRTMRLDAEAEDHPMLSSKHDERTTRVGRWLRDHHLDELPQLWNVLRGDMSFVGYRPERQYFIDKITWWVEDFR